jgi:hypothetical protein
MLVSVICFPMSTASVIASGLIYVCSVSLEDKEPVCFAFQNAFQILKENTYSKFHLVSISNLCFENFNLYFTVKNENSEEYQLGCFLTIS